VGGLNLTGSKTRVRDSSEVDAEVIYSVKIIEARRAIGGSLCSAAFDDAAVTVADAVIEKYAYAYPEEPKMLRTRAGSRSLYRSCCKGKCESEVFCGAAIPSQVHDQVSER
jgi:hypothetical protein